LQDKKVNDQLTEFFPTKLGVKQGDNLSPNLFKIFLNELPNYLQVSKDPVILDSKTVHCLMYANDVVLLSTSASGLQEKLDILDKFCNDWCLTINTQKTKIMIFNKAGKLIKQKFLLDKGKIKEDKLNPTDGFHEDDELGKDYVKFGNDGSTQEIYHLHGALHIFDKKNKIIKNTFSRTDIALKEQTLQNLKDDIYPIFVSEGTSEQKQAKIIHNAYLNHCYKSLGIIGGTKLPSNLIVFGTLLKTNDTHIREAILKNKIKNIYFGISTEEEKESLAEFAKQLSKARVPKKVYFYDYRTVKVWR